MKINIFFNSHRIYNSRPTLRFIWFLFLLPISLLYGLVVVVRQLLYRLQFLKSYKSSIPVLSVGNISSGGTGKTPLVVNLTKHFTNLGKRVAILTRGYKGYEKGPHYVTGIDSVRFGDEACMLYEMLPEAKVVVSKDRVEGAKFIEQSNEFDLIILDDGYQHIRLKRSFDLVLVDSTRGFLDNFMLPSGLLREPWFMLKRANAVLLTRTNYISFEESKNLRAKLSFVGQVFRSQQQLGSYYSLLTSEHLNPNHIQEKKSLLVCALGNPFQFLKSVEKMGFSVKGQLFFSDHYQFQYHDLQKMISVAQKIGADQILMTEKDAVKIKPLLKEYPNKALEFVVATLDIEIENQELFYDLVTEKLF